MGVCDFNEPQVLDILEALRLSSRNFNGGLIVESDSFNTIPLVSNQKAIPRKFQFHFIEIRKLSSSINVAFQHDVRSTNSMVDVLAKQGVE